MAVDLGLWLNSGTFVDLAALHMCQEAHLMVFVDAVDVDAVDAASAAALLAVEHSHLWQT